VADNKLGWAVAQYNAADEAGRKTQQQVAQSKCEADDQVGKSLENWKFERGMINPSRIPNNELSRRPHCEAATTFGNAIQQALNLKQQALKGCTLRPGGSQFDVLDCSTYAGMDACKKALAELKRGLLLSGPGNALGDASQLCNTKAVAAGQDFLNVLKQHDPKGRCTLQAGGKTVQCARDLSVPRACNKAKGDYASDLAGNVTVGTNKPIIDVTCVVQRDAEYSTLVSQTAAASTQIASALNGQAMAAVADYNAWQTNPQLKIAAGAGALFGAVVQVSATDPLLLSVQAPTGSSGDWIRSTVNNLSFGFGKLTTVDAADPENDGQNRPAVSFVAPPPSPEQQKQMEQIADAIDKKVKGLLTAPPPQPAGGQQAAARINPADFAGRSDPVGRLLARPDMAGRFTPAELESLAAVQHTRGASGAVSYKAVGAAQIAALQKAQMIAAQLGLGSFSFGP
jgi:hypothetical protein